MSMRSDILMVADAFAAATRRSRARVSTIVFNDGSKLDLIDTGGDLTTRSYERAMQWFAANWPADAAWPAGIARPEAAA